MTDKVSLVLQDLHGKHKTPTYTYSVVYTQWKTKGINNNYFFSEDMQVTGMNIDLLG